MDIRMQPMDGITASKKIKDLTNYLQVPITAVSAEPINPQSTHYFNECLIKPILKSDLKRILLDITGLSADTSIFDEQQALAIAHQDHEIVNHLRALLAADLPAQLASIKQLQQQQDWQELDEQLHRLLGSVKVCAAISLEHCINNYQLTLVKTNRKQANNHLEALQQAGKMLLRYVTETT